MDSPELEDEAQDIQATIEHELSQSSGSGYLDCFRQGDDKVRLRVLTGIGLQALQQLSGINFVGFKC